MAIPARYYRVPVLIFAVLAAVFYVYAKSGGTFSDNASAAAPNGAAKRPDPNSPEFMMGSKSAPAFSGSPTTVAKPAQATPLQSPGRAPTSGPSTLPGSKFGSVFRAQDVAPRQPVVQEYPLVPVPPQTNRPAAPPRPTSPGTLTSAPNAPYGEPRSASPTASYNNRPARYDAPPAVPPPPPPPTYVPPNASNASPAASRATMHGTKSAPMIGPEFFAPTAKPSKPGPPTATSSYPPQAMQQPRVAQPAPREPAKPKSPQQSMKQAVNSWIHPPAQRVNSR